MNINSSNSSRKTFPLSNSYIFLITVNKKIKQCPSTPIIFPHLRFLDLKYAHVGYAKQFLLAEKTHPPRLLNLCIQIKTITCNFTIDAMQFNFGTLKSVDVCQPFARPENSDQYFPLL